ncbi:hypothetical protein JEQ12_008685 [Ovis aries]|uniref:C2H2-type domain-containing protein n=1 Tax=Ovis aries TaxID=9940 RepID=A0A836D5V3_SHEEP|nr:hypothetical protein JEQ12_008685 [Ovis aries]
MYHNPEKPFACDICHKRFHAIFKVWTHCRTQHGVAKNPAPAASSHAVLDEKLQRKLLDTVREREIKQALILKLRRGRPGFHGPGGPPAQVLKRGLRSRAKGPLKIQVKEEPAEEAEEQKCGKTFPAPKQLERHQELLCSVKPFTCHVCNKAFRTNFRLWSHFQPHMAQASEDPVHRDPEAGPGPAGSPSQPPLPPPLPKIQPLEPNSPTHRPA